MDKYVKNSSLPTKDQFGFEKMQGFSGIMSQLNFWKKILTQDKIDDLSNCKGKTIDKINAGTYLIFIRNI